MIHSITEVRIAPSQLPLDVLGVRLDQQLVGIESMALRGIVRTMHAISIEPAGAGFWQVAVPGLVRAFAQLDALQLTPAVRIEQTQLDSGGVRGEHGKIHAFAIPGRAT